MHDVLHLSAPAPGESHTEETKALVARLEAGQEPLVLTGAVAHWRAVRHWTPGYLEERLGGFQITCKSSTSNAHPDFRQTDIARMFAREQTSLGRFLRKISDAENDERWRWLFTGDEQFLLRQRDGVRTVQPGLAPLLDDIEQPPWFTGEQLYTVWSWFSAAGVRTWLHYDNNGCHNLNAQVCGSKRCWLYPPDELPRMHPFLLGSGNPAHNCSRIDVEYPQPEFAEDLQAADCWQAEISAGDLLFIPAWWFHTFHHDGEFNANVNFWWRPESPPWNVVAARQALLDAAARASNAGCALDDETLLALDTGCVNSAEDVSAY